MGGSPVILSKNLSDTIAGLFSKRINQFLTVFNMFILFLGFCTAIFAVPSWVAAIVWVEAVIVPLIELLTINVHRVLT